MRFSQNEEETILLQFFRDFKGRFLDIGASDGLWLSNTRQMALNGWTGVLVEPGPSMFLKLLQTYPPDSGFICINAAVSGSGGLKKFYYEKERDFANSLNPDIAEADVFHPAGNYYVSSITPGDLILFGPFDFISIDAEWEDWNILQAAENLLKPCRCLCVEIPYQQGDDGTRFVRLLKEYGFAVYYETRENLILTK